jgi:hypothetical protein
MLRYGKKIISAMQKRKKAKEKMRSIFFDLNSVVTRFNFPEFRIDCYFEVSKE